MKLKFAHLVAGGAVALAGAVALPALTGAQTPTGTTITVQEKVQVVVQDDVAPKSKARRVSVGDRLVTRQSLFDADKRRIGTLYSDCTSVGPAGSFPRLLLLCKVTYRLADGQIVAMGAIRFDDADAALAIVGGTGDYAGARGTVKTAKPLPGYDSADVITISG